MSKITEATNFGRHIKYLWRICIWLEIDNKKFWWKKPDLITAQTRTDAVNALPEMKRGNGYFTKHIRFIDTNELNASKKASFICNCIWGNRAIIISYGQRVPLICPKIASYLHLCTHVALVTRLLTRKCFSDTWNIEEEQINTRSFIPTNCIKQLRIVYRKWKPQCDFAFRNRNMIFAKHLFKNLIFKVTLQSAF